jgi:glutamyl-tRNA synthetase
MSDSQLVRTRMAPSPTGEYHVGHIATLLKNYAFAKKNGGQFVLRIEDTDRERYVDGAVERIMSVIKDYGLDWDEGPDIGGPYAPYTQSERLPIYKEKAMELVEGGAAYYCFCTRERLETIREEQRAAKKPPKYDRHCVHLTAEEVQQRLAKNEPYVIRLRVPDDEPVAFRDLIRGDISIHSSEVDDQVLLKSDGFPTYHLAVVVDDQAMNITHIMRGEEWISSTPKHVLLYRAFGWKPPIYAHIPVFLNPDGKGKMSKRKGTVAARSFLDEGYLPEAMLNFFMILGWAPQDQREIITLEEYIQEFDPQDISAKSVVFDLQKLRWLNGMYIRNLSAEQLVERTRPFWPADFPADKAKDILPLIHERLELLSDVEALTNFFYRDITTDSSLLLKKADEAIVKQQLNEVIQAIKNLSAWSLESIEQTLRSLQEQHDWKKGQFFMMLRVATTGGMISPPLFETIHVLGKETVVSRLENALHFSA